MHKHYKDNRWLVMAQVAYPRTTPPPATLPLESRRVCVSVVPGVDSLPQRGWLSAAWLWFFVLPRTHYKSVFNTVS